MAGLQLKNIRKSYGAVDVIHGIDLDIKQGEFVVFVGPSGCGKSTLLRMIAGLEEISGGEMYIADRLVNELSGGEQKRLALEMLLTSDSANLLLDEPDNFLDIVGKRWLEQMLNDSPRTILLVSHDRELLARSTRKIVTLEGYGAWVHGQSFATYHEAREARQDRLEDALQRWNEEERRLYRHMRTMKQRAAISDANASQAQAAETRWKKFVDAGPPASLREPV